MPKKPIIIAEVKPESPTFRSDKSWDELFDIADTVGDWISIHTNALWGGSFDLIAKTRARTEKPILAKGLHETDDDVRRAIQMGADYALVVGRIPEVHQDKCLIEPYDIAEFLNIPKEFKMVWNSRDLRALINKTEPQKREHFSNVRKMRPSVWLCQASNIKTKNDIDPEADAVLVGTDLETFAKSLLS